MELRNPVTTVTSRILPTLNSPELLRHLSMDGLRDLAAEMRAVICEQVAKSGGHLAPNLGVVELSIAMHRVFDFSHDPVGEYLDLASTSDLVTGAAGLVPSALIPAPSTATAAEKWAVKRATLEGMYEMQRKDGLLLYEALVGAGRTADADRLKRELKSRYPVPPIPQGDSEEDVALRRLLKDVLPPGDLDSRLRAAEERAKGAGAE